jgi:hypothetical protein
MWEQAPSPALYDSVAWSKAAATWQAVLANDNPQLIWDRLHLLVQRTIGDETVFHATTQELFLLLLGEGLMEFYIQRGLTDEEIEEDLISRLSW